MPLSGKEQRSMEDHFVFDGKAGWQQEESKKIMLKDEEKDLMKRKAAIIITTLMMLTFAAGCSGPADTGKTNS